MKARPENILLTAVGLCGLVAACSLPAIGTDTQPAARHIKYGKGRFVCHLADRSITESSGLASSRRHPNVLWTHNDSGARADVHAFDMAGRNLGTWRVQGAASRDWEDMASFTLGGKHWLLLADVGDNERRRKTPRLYLVPEPDADPNRPAGPGVRQVRAAMTIPFCYDNGCQDCEAVAVDPNARVVILIAKRGKRVVYEMPLPDRAPPAPLTARKIATLDLGWVSAMDISPDGRRAIVGTYGNLLEFTRSPGESWAAAFARKGRMIVAPLRRQGEAVCFGRDGKTIYLTSEGSPCPLMEICPALSDE